MMRRSICKLARKLVTIPRLAPTHTSARIVQRLVPSGTHVVEYQPVMTLQCSSDMIADPADRLSPEHQQIMLLEVMEEGTIKWNRGIETIDEKEWLSVGTVLGEVDDGDKDEEGIEEEWAWQAYLHDNSGESQT